MHRAALRVLRSAPRPSSRLSLDGLLRRPLSLPLGHREDDVRPKDDREAPHVFGETRGVNGCASPPMALGLYDEYRLALTWALGGPSY